MFGPPLPSKKPTPSEYAVLVWFVCLMFIGLGLAAIIAGLRAPEEKAEAAAELMMRGGWCLAIGLGIAGLYWLYRRLIDF